MTGRLEWDDLDCKVDYDTGREVWVDFTVWEEHHPHGKDRPVRETVVAGFIKWDGCCNFDFNPDRQIMMHTCLRSDLERLGDILTRIYDVLGPMNRSWEYGGAV